jgi:predicted anti-sigma-YlaC factor YlaD
LSARLDGEDSGVPDSVVDRHLVDCSACRAWYRDAQAMRRRLRLSSAAPVPDLTDAILRRLGGKPRRRSAVPLWRIGLVGVAIVQLAITVRTVTDSIDHATHDMGAVWLAMAMISALAAARPRFAAGAAPVVFTLVAASLVIAAVDIAAGRVHLVDESPHLLQLGMAALIWAEAHGAGPRRRRPMPA